MYKAIVSFCFALILLINNLPAQNVGIGISNPVAKLQINSTTLSTPQLLISDPGNIEAGTLRFKNANNLKNWQINSYISSGQSRVADSLIIKTDSAKSALIIRGNGNVGIGASSGFKLHVDGNILALTDITSFNGDLIALTGNVVTNGGTFLKGGADVANPRIGFSAYVSQPQNVNNGSPIINFDAVDISAGACWDAATHSFIAPSDGLYHFDVGLFVPNAPDEVYIYVYFWDPVSNGLTEAGFFYAAEASITGSITIKMSASQRLIIRGGYVDQALIPLGLEKGRTYFSGFKVF